MLAHATQTRFAEQNATQMPARAVHPQGVCTGTEVPRADLDPAAASARASSETLCVPHTIAWTALDAQHLALREFGPGIWVADGPVVSVLTFPYPTRTAVITLSDGSVFVWSPVALHREMRTLGRVRYLVSPNALHHLFLTEWKSAYPDARLYAPPGLRKRRKDLAFDADLSDRPEREWTADLDQVIVRGSFLLTEVVFFHRTSGTVLFADLIQNFPHGWFKGWRGYLARLDGIVAPNPGAPREWRASFLRRRAARAVLERILSWPIQRVLIAHGEPVNTNGDAFVRHAFAWLLQS
jgi:Domain of unknown function (DUF4336)